MPFLLEVCIRVVDDFLNGNPLAGLHLADTKHELLLAVAIDAMTCGDRNVACDECRTT